MPDATWYCYCGNPSTVVLHWVRKMENARSSGNKMVNIFTPTASLLRCAAQFQVSAVEYNWLSGGQIFGSRFANYPRVVNHWQGSQVDCLDRYGAHLRPLCSLTLPRPLLAIHWPTGIHRPQSTRTRLFHAGGKALSSCGELHIYTEKGG